MTTPCSLTHAEILNILLLYLSEKTNEVEKITVTNIMCCKFSVAVFLVYQIADPKKIIFYCEIYYSLHINCENQLLCMTKIHISLQ